jgi:hypothetical protein
MIVDWDDPVLAPRERDLMFVGAGVGGAWNREDESAAFYRGYGPVTVDAQSNLDEPAEGLASSGEILASSVLPPTRRKRGRHLDVRSVARGRIERAGMNTPCLPREPAASLATP